MPGSHRELFPSVDENKALEELERFQREIQKARWKREQAVAEFERFVKGFREGPQPGAAPPQPGAPSPPPASVRAVRRHSVTPAPPAIAPQPAPAPSETTPPARPSASMRLQHWRGVVLGIAALVVIGGLAIRSWRAAPASVAPRDTAVATPPSAAPVAATRAPAAKPATAAAAQPGTSGHAAMLTTTRRAWVRVTLDGRRAFERELPAGASIPLDARQAILIRAGNGGAVRITLADGRSEILGAEGQVVTKRFDVKR